MKLKNIFKILLSFLLAAFFLYLAFRGVDFSALLLSLKSANYWWIVLLVPIVLLGHWIRALRWKYLMAPIKKDCSLSNLFGAVMIGYAVNNVLPRVGELVRPYVLGQKEKVSKSATLATVVVERILDLLSFYFITCVALAVYPHALDPFFSNAESVRPFFYIGAFAGLCFFLLLFFKADTFFRYCMLMKKITPKKYSAKIDHILDSFARGLGVIKMKDKFAVIILLSIAIQGIYALGMYEPFFAFSSLVKPELDFGASVVLLIVSSIAWILPAPGAMGTYHSFLTIAMVKLYGVDTATALSYSIVTHELGYIIFMVFGAYYYFKDHINVADFRLGEKNDVDDKDTFESR
jgi:uncharacterized protein (TIRG00374 family)